MSAEVSAGCIDQVGLELMNILPLSPHPALNSEDSCVGETRSGHCGCLQSLGTQIPAYSVWNHGPEGGKDGDDGTNWNGADANAVGQSSF